MGRDFGRQDASLLQPTFGVSLVLLGARSRVCRHFQSNGGRNSLAIMEQLMRSLERGGNPLPQQFQIAHAELAAYIDTATGNMTKGLEELNRAAVSESLLPYTDPTVYPRPVLELLGRTALKARNFRTAEC